MRSLLIIEVHPLIDIGLELLQAGVELTPESGGIELILNGLMKALANAIGLRTLSLGARMLDILQVQIQLILVMFSITAVLATAVSKNAQQWHTLLFIPRQR